MRSKLIPQNPTFSNPNYRPNFARNSAAPRLLRAEGPRASSKRPVCSEQAMLEVGRLIMPLCFMTYDFLVIFYCMGNIEYLYIIYILYISIKLINN